MGRIRTTSPPAPDLTAAADLAGALVDACGRAVRAPIGTLQACVVAFLSGGHVMIEDVPGVGKTVLAKSLARAAGCDFARLQCTADLLPSDVTGITVWDQAAGSFMFRPGPVFANVVLVDEVNRASPRTQSALLECMEEGQVTVDGDTRPLPRPFLVVATQNPVEYEGTFPLPEAQLDRFAVRVHIGYPPAAEEAGLLLGGTGDDPAASVPVVADEARILAARAAVAGVHIEPVLADYVVALAEATRADPRVRLGVSPRGSLALARAARALAVLDGRSHCLPDDVKALAPAVLTHRILVTAEARSRGIDAAEIVAEALSRVPVP